ncbi:MAG: hypothetical protein JST83_08295, partial [Bacteroidetes bacterium]|nr:hypothetical protein [Bacteroidota bacterium]
MKEVLSKRTLLYSVLLGIGLLLSHGSKAQYSQFYTVAQNTPYASFSAPVTQNAIGLDAGIANLNYDVNRADLNVRFHFSDEFKYGLSSSYSITLAFTIEADDRFGQPITSAFTNNQIVLQLDQDHPEAVFYKDFSLLQERITSFKLTSLVVTGIPSLPSAIQASMLSSLVLTTQVHKEYRVGGDLPNASNSVSPVVSIS